MGCIRLKYELLFAGHFKPHLLGQLVLEPPDGRLDFEVSGAKWSESGVIEVVSPQECVVAYHTHRT